MTKTIAFLLSFTFTISVVAFLSTPVSQLSEKKKVEEPIPDPEGEFASLPDRNRFLTMSLT